MVFVIFNNFTALLFIKPTKLLNLNKKSLPFGGECRIIKSRKAGNVSSKFDKTVHILKRRNTQ